jgi:hypothetical protein
MPASPKALSTRVNWHGDEDEARRLEYHSYSHEEEQRLERQRDSWPGNK